MNVIAILRETRKDLQSTAMSSSDPAHRSAARHRRAAVTGITSGISRAVRIGVTLITIPLTLHYLGNERFGLWMTISSVLAMAGFADFGVGNGVLNTVSTAYGKDDWDGIRQAISSGIAVLTLIGAAILIIFLANLPTRRLGKFISRHYVYRSRRSRTCHAGVHGLLCAECSAGCRPTRPARPAARISDEFLGDIFQHPDPRQEFWLWFIFTSA